MHAAAQAGWHELDPPLPHLHVLRPPPRGAAGSARLDWRCLVPNGRFNRTAGARSFPQIGGLPIGVVDVALAAATSSAAPLAYKNKFQFLETLRHVLVRDHSANMHKQMKLPRKRHTIYLADAMFIHRK